MSNPSKGFPILQNVFTRVVNAYACKVMSRKELPYNGIFSRRQIFAVLSQKHGDYFSRILIFAVGQRPRKIISILFRENHIEGVA